MMVIIRVLGLRVIGLSGNTHLSLIEADIAMKACSTFKAFFALVSMNGMPISSANACIHKMSAQIAERFASAH
jgi:hypothetical protein